MSCTELSTMIEVADIQIKYNLSRSMAKALHLLMDRQHVKPSELKEELETVLDAKMVIHKLRKKMKVFGISIQSRRDVGYWLDDSVKAALLKAFAGDAPAGHAGEGEGTEEVSEVPRPDDDHTT